MAPVPRLNRGVNAGRVLVGEGNLPTEAPGLHWDWKVEIGATTRPNQVDHFSPSTTQKFFADQPKDRRRYPGGGRLALTGGIDRRRYQGRTAGWFLGGAVQNAAPVRRAPTNCFSVSEDRL